MSYVTGHDTAATHVPRPTSASALEDDMDGLDSWWLRQGVLQPAPLSAAQDCDSADMISTAELFEPADPPVPRNGATRRPAEGQLKMLCARMLMLAGHWDRALGQLEVAACLDAHASLLAHTYRGLIYGERTRAAVFAGQSSPGVLGGTKPWLAQLVTSLSLDRQGHTAWATELRVDAFEVAPLVRGSVNGSEFATIVDADSRLGPVLEVIVGGSYYWAPFACIQQIKIHQPGNARDLLWLPAEFTWRTGEQSTGFIPVRYPGSEHSEEGSIRLGRTTHWQPMGEGCYTGLGQRQLTSDTARIGITDVRTLSFATITESDRSPAGA